MSITRIYFNDLWKEHNQREISIMLGARQVGKSTLLRQLEAKAKKEGTPTVFYDLEQSSDLKELGASGDEGELIARLTQRARIIFIDEFHYLKNSSKIFKAIYDSGRKIKIYASGSSSLEIHKHLKESLAGRFTKRIIYPLSLIEWKEVKGFKEAQYLQWGGLPGLIRRRGSKKRLELLENILNTYITKDIKGLIKEENVRAFNLLLYSLAQSQGSISSVSNLAQETGLSESSVTRYLELMSQTYVLYGLSSYSTNMANELKKSKKYYFFDSGIRNLLIKDMRPADKREDKGVLYETAVLLELIPQLKPNMEIRFWRTKKQDEVDFVLLKNRIPIPVEIKSSQSPPNIPKGITSFMRKYPKAPFAIVFSAHSDKKTILFEDKRPIYFENWSRASSVDYLKSIF